MNPGAETRTMAFCLDENCPECNYPELSAVVPNFSGWPQTFEWLEISHYCRNCGWYRGDPEPIRAIYGDKFTEREDTR